MRYVGSGYAQSQLFNANGTPIGPKAVVGPIPCSDLDYLSISEGHPWPRKGSKRPKRPKKPNYKGKKYAQVLQAYAIRLAGWRLKLKRWKEAQKADMGGPFQVQHMELQPALHRFVGTRVPVAGVVQRYEATSVAYNGSLFRPTTANLLAPSNNTQLDAMGSIGIAKALPTNPIANIGQFIGELRQLPTIYNPQLWEGKARNFRRLAHEGSGEYLNAQFGWIPFVNDIIDFFEVSMKFQKHINQYARDSGKHIRRRRHVSDDSSTVATVMSTNALPYPAAASVTSGGTLNRVVETTQDAWFSGSFTYYLPEIDGSVASYFSRYSSYARKLYGISLSPDVLWQLTPWSWALGWISNSSSVVRNWDAFSNQNLVMHYGYLMETRRQTTTYTLSGYMEGTKRGPDLMDRHFNVCKVRRKATPYGFGQNPANFSPFQKSIIAALGINFVSGWLR